MYMKALRADLTNIVNILANFSIVFSKILILMFKMFENILSLFVLLHACLIYMYISL